jgi:nucleoside-diphosphate-sugar epimerase
VADVTAGRPIASFEDGFLNLIHVSDAATAVIQSWNQHSHPLYLVSDDQPVRRGEFYREIARQTGSPEPQFVPPRSESAKSARSDSNKRIRNTRMKSDLIPHLRYPTYREGLADVLKSSL